HEETNDLPRAIDAMERLVAAERPRDRSLPEVDEVLADGYARLAELRLRNGELQSASEAAARGLGHAPEPTYFRGHLVEIQGLIEEARGDVAADAGQPEAAAEARRRAID